MHRIHNLWMVGICLAMAGCVSDIATPQGNPVVESHSGSQSRAEINSSGQKTGTADRAGSLERFVSEIAISDLSSGSVSKLLLDRSVANSAIAIHNGSDVLVQLKTESNVTGVTVEGDAVAPTTLRRISSGDWQGTFQYWDGANTPNSKSKITVLLVSAKRSIKKELFITTVHDS